MFSWRAHPMRERVWRATIGIAIITILGALTGLMMQNPWWGLLAVVILVGFLNRFFFPSRFAIDENGITASYPLGRQRLRWDELRRFAYGEDGGYLSRRARRSRLDGFRGMHVLFGRQRESVIEQIRRRLPEGESAWAH